MTISTAPSPFDRVFDLVVVGSGHAGYAATVTARSRAQRVLLVGPAGALVWESGRAFCPDAGDCRRSEWRALADAVTARGGRREDWLDGAITEVVATDRLLNSGAEALYYARPVAAEREGDALSAVILATKVGLRRIAARQWIDATETGELCRLLDPVSSPRSPQCARVHMLLQHADWSSVPRSGALRPTAWPTERLLSVQVNVGDQAWRTQVLSAVEELESLLGDHIAAVSLSHLSFEPVSEYAAGVATPAPADNLALAVPGHAAQPVTTLADRFLLGVSAVHVLDRLEAHDTPEDVLAQPLPAIVPVRTVRTDVCVAGLGTGGALAALAAAQAGARVVCVDPLPFAGGTGVGGGIHGYYYGFAGGLQNALDARTRELMRQFRRGPLGDGPFNPWAKMIALERMLRERDVDVHSDALVFAVETDDDRVRAALAATPDGVVRIDASTYVDGTGDGDLCALAGAEYTLGREHDGLLHAYSQSSGRLHECNGRPRMDVVNFDAGFCDPTDPVDLTRARLVGVQQYLLDSYGNLDRPTYIAPAIGIRQGRQIVADYMLTLDDQIRRRRFDDPIGYTGAHYDNHATDLEFESDESVFWTWLNRQWALPYGCEMSYRMIVPRGLANIWIGSRALGVTQDAHYATRMQRDIQRAGEAAGFAAAEAARLELTAQELPYGALRRWLDETGALDTGPRRLQTRFGHFDFGGAALRAEDLRDCSTDSAALAALDRGEPGEGIWWLYKHEAEMREAVLERLARTAADEPMVSWLAAAIVAMWGNQAAEPRLLQALDSLEYGFGAGMPWAPYGAPARPDGYTPLNYNKVVPHWLTAVALLRRCGSDACVPALERLIDRPLHGLSSVTTVALTLERLAIRHQLDETITERIALLLERMSHARVIGARDYAIRDTGRYSELALRGEVDIPASVALLDLPDGPKRQLSNAAEDSTWQLHLAIARARAALGLSLDQQATAYMRDPRGLVRRAFRALATPHAGALAGSTSM